MMKTKRNWRRELSRRLTVMIVPHGTARPVQISFSVMFIVFTLGSWTLFTAWASYMASERFDYWRAKANSHILKIKMDYLAQRLKESREVLDEVKEVDTQLRALVAMGSREAIVQSETPLSAQVGGPTGEDEKRLDQILEGRLSEMSFKDISRQFELLHNAAEDRLESYREIRATIEQERHRFRATPNTWPIKGQITSHFGSRNNPLHGSHEFHKGVDIGAPTGTPVRATADGVVRMAGWAGGYGKLVILNHDFGHATLYAHNRQLLVKAGDTVKRGQIIALVGSTGNATGPHTHYEVWLNNRRVNPKMFMARDN